MTYYFQTCCVKTTNSDNYFGLSNFTGDTLNINEIYSVITPEFRACGYVITGPIPSTSKIYDGSNVILTNYGDCTTCIGSDDSVSCFPPSPPSITAYTLSNECNVITIFPMGVACNPNDTKDPSYYGAIDGKASVTISGGTPPYKTVWWGGSDNQYGSVSSAIQNLPAGSYTAITEDYWKDYSAITICTLTDPTPSPTPTPTLTPAIACPSCVGTEIQIGTQLWTRCNLDVDTYRDLTPIPQAVTDADWESYATNKIGAWCYFDNDPANGPIYGKLYNLYAVLGIWNEASLLEPLLRKEFAPIGYHVPSVEETDVLINYLGGASVAGGNLKTTGTIEGNDGCWLAPNEGATNSSGFRALPGGFRVSFGNFEAGNYGGSWWDSLGEQSIDGVQLAGLTLFNNTTYAGNAYYRTAGDGNSVRLIKDSPPSSPTPTPTLTITPTVTPTEGTIPPSPTQTPTQTQTPTITPTITQTQTPTITPTITLTPTPSSTKPAEPTISTSLWTNVTADNTFYNILTSPTDLDAKCIWEIQYPKTGSIPTGLILKSFVNIDIGVQLYQSNNQLYLVTGRFIMDSTNPPTPGYVLPNKYVIHTTLGVVDSITNFTSIECNTPTFCNSGNVTIGNITWACRNLDVTTYRDGSVITDANGYNNNQWTGLTTGAWCYYSGNSANGVIYGKLYNWYAVNDPRGLAPSGYHISTKNEWEETIACLCGPINASGKLKEAGTTHWKPTNINGTNFSDFTALPGGYRAGAISAYFGLNSSAWFWTSTESDTQMAFSCLMDGSTNPGIGISTRDKRNAFSIRLVKD